MSDATWNAVRDELGHHSLTLGPYFAYQAVHTPRHLLFTMARYKFAARMLPQHEQVKVLELACGEGMGTLMLAEAGHHVTGIDFDARAIEHAQKTLARDNVAFSHADFLGRKFGEFDVVVSMDAIEHIVQDKEDLFLKTICDNLTPTGFGIIGTPNITASQYASSYSQIGHVNLFSAERLSALLRRYFASVFLFGMNDEVLHTGFYPMCHYIVALACGKREG